MSATFDLISLPQSNITLTGATFDPNMEFETWAALGGKISRIEQATRWIMGDWLNFGHQRYIEGLKDKKEAPKYRVKYEEAMKVLDQRYQRETLYNCCSVAKRVNVSLRSEKLSFAHHEVVAALDPKAQAKFLKIAEADSLSVAELRKRVRESEAEDIKEVAPGWGKFSPLKQVTEWCLWWQQADVETMPRPAAENWLRELDRLEEANRSVRERLLARLSA